jgi:uracil-DNA glycosylase
MWQKSFAKTRRILGHSPTKAEAAKTTYLRSQLPKILAIGQAPPDRSQDRPFDTTQWYDWLKDAGVQADFTYEALVDFFPGRTSQGAHRAPSKKEIETHWEKKLSGKFHAAKRVITLGRVAENWITGKFQTEQHVVHLPHPSRRNISLYRKQQDNIIESLRSVCIA